MDLNYFAKTVQAKCAGAGQKARQDLGSHPSLGGIDMQNRGFEPRNKYELGESFGMGCARYLPYFSEKQTPRSDVMDLGALENHVPPSRPPSPRATEIAWQRNRPISTDSSFAV